MARRTEKLAFLTSACRMRGPAAVGVCAFLGACFTSTPQLPIDHSSKKWIISAPAENDGGASRFSTAHRTPFWHDGSGGATDIYEPRRSPAPGKSDLTSDATLGRARTPVDVVAPQLNVVTRSSSASAAASSSPVTDLPVGFETLIGKARVLDAVHLEIDEYRIRLQGVSVTRAGLPCNAEESGDICAAAQKWLMDNIHGQETRCEGWRHSPASPLIAVCSIKGRVINAEMVRAGSARADANAFPSYAAEESEARSRQIGLWRIAAPAAK